MMRRLKYLSFGLVSAAALMIAAPAAKAADVYDGGGSIKDTGPVDYTPTLAWTGFYLGGNIGAAFDDEDDSDEEFIGGAHLGYNWQRSSNLVLGLEGDVDFADGLDYLATIRGRIGYGAGPALIYATGGVAFIGLDDDIDDIDETGWVLGGGLDYKIRDNWSVGAEGLYYNFDADDGDADFWTARARLTYHFGSRY